MNHLGIFVFIMGFGHSHSKKRKLVRQNRSASSAAQHDLAHLEGQGSSRSVRSSISTRAASPRRTWPAVSKFYAFLASSASAASRRLSVDSRPTSRTQHSRGGTGRPSASRSVRSRRAPGRVGKISRGRTRLERLERGSGPLPGLRARSRALGQGPQHFLFRARRTAALRRHKHVHQVALS